MQAQAYQDRYARAEAKRREAAKALLEYHLSGIRRWLFAHRRSDGHPFFMIYGAAPSPYYVDLHDCTCDSHRKGRVACKHMLAVRLWFDGVKRGEIPKPGTQTVRDTDLLEEASAIAEALDVANAADALLDAYDRILAERRRAEPATDWWTTDDGGIVWLQEGDVVTHDAAPPEEEIGEYPNLDALIERADDGDGAAEEGLAELEWQQSQDVAPVEPPRTTRPVGLVRSYSELFGKDDD